MKNKEKPYRKNVGIVVFNSSGRVLAGERIQYPGIFQFPQGGLDKGENPVDAARRELYEETGLLLREEPVYEIPDWLYYEFPEDIPAHLKKYRGQAQKWFFFKWDGEISQLKLDLHEREFLTVKWYEIQKLVDEIVEFKKATYLRVLEEAKNNIKNFFT